MRESERASCHARGLTCFEVRAGRTTMNGLIARVALHVRSRGRKIEGQDVFELQVCVTLCVRPCLAQLAWTHAHICTLVSHAWCTHTCSRITNTHACLGAGTCVWGTASHAAGLVRQTRAQYHAREGRLPEGTH